MSESDVENESGIANELAAEDLGQARAPRPNRTIWVMASIALLSLLGGIGISQFIISPAQQAAEAEAPQAGPITVEVEHLQLATQITARGDARYDDAIDVRIETGEIDGAAVVTGQVPQVGTTMDAGAVLIEVTGRPVIVLPGELPAYRTLRVGSSGPDVAQLKAALVAQGIKVGNADSDVYDADTSTAVDALYEKVGYTPPAPGEEAVAALDAARDGLTAAKGSLAESQASLNAAAAGPSPVEQLQLQAEIDNATVELQSAKHDGDQAAITQAQNALNIAVAERDAAFNPDTSLELAARDSAAAAVEDAEQDVTDARADTYTHLPAAEVIFAATLPRRVDEVNVGRGSAADGVLVSISGAALHVLADISQADAELVALDMPALLDVDGTEVAATVTAISDTEDSTDTPPSDQDSDEDSDEDTEEDSQSANDSARVSVTLTPTELTEGQRTALAGSNVQVSIPLDATEGEVVAVPVAALTSGPGGETRVEVLQDDGSTELVEVETGLAADGYAEVTSSQPTLNEGDLVVVGR
ncbi:MAG: hypothetical protein ACK5H2_01770 [Beutenbergiaceae bacterium]